LIYWFFTALITKPIAQVAVIVTLAPLLWLTGSSSFESLLRGHGPFGRQPPLLQAVQMLIVIDFVGYWLHRAFHSAKLWRVHAIHHSSAELDWLSAARLHPLNDIVNKRIQAMTVVALGYAPALLAGALPLFTAYAIFLHANVSWDFGPLRALLASPRCHRWHHTSAEQGRDKNFAGLLPLWDVLFGSYYMPEAQPLCFGVSEKIPAHLLGQLLWPFKSGRVSAPQNG